MLTFEPAHINHANNANVLSLENLEWNPPGYARLHIAGGTPPSDVLVPHMSSGHRSPAQVHGKQAAALNNDCRVKHRCSAVRLGQSLRNS